MFFWRQKSKFHEYALLNTRLDFWAPKKPIPIIIQGAKCDTRLFRVRKVDYNNSPERISDFPFWRQNSRFSKCAWLNTILDLLAANNSILLSRMRYWSFWRQNFITMIRRNKDPTCLFYGKIADFHNLRG